ncbi:MAG: helicase [Candidatus Eremiobacteraeota bacterium]|nr:helicase [Candidatus Eremiobacteraeota bacterium]
MNFSGVPPFGGSSQTDDPIKIFDESPKPPGINDLYKSQADVLRTWYESSARDTVVKMHTGGGKTLVGLLIAKSILIASGKPVLYLCPNNQLAEQTLRKASLYSIDAVGYPPSGFPAAFDNADAVMIANYKALFNGQSRFGTASGNKPAVELGGIIVDDAHAAFADLRDVFTYTASAREDPEFYRYLSNLFRDDFDAIGKLGTFDDIATSAAASVLEVPYWAWRAKEGEIRAAISARPSKDSNGKLIDEERFFKWPFLRDQLYACHALVSARGFTITPILPLVDEVPSYAECPQRVFMSATVNDDSTLIRTFRVDDSYLAIAAPGATGIAERYIFAPAFTSNFESSYDETTQYLAKHVSGDRDKGVIVLAPSEKSATPWDSTAKIVKGHAEVVKALAELNAGATRGPIVFLNRYDGLDLPEDACRLVVLWDLPHGAGDYDDYRATMLYGGDELAAAVARTIEQGMGRGARGASDYCIVIFAGRSLESWIAKRANLRHLSLATQIQIEIGRGVSSSLNSVDELKSAVDTVLDRDKRWTTMHASRLSASLEQASQEKVDTSVAFDERQAFALLRSRRFEETRRKYEAIASKTTDSRLTAWYLQLAARSALYGSDATAAERLQNDASASNDRFPRPLQNRRYLPIAEPTDQSRAIAAIIEEHDPPSGTLISIVDDLANLTPQSSATQFEESLARLGRYLGFATQRPEKSDKIGPDVLWLAPGHAFVLEAKSRKFAQNRIAKSEVGQLLTSATWFEERYPGVPFTHAIVAPNPTRENNVVAGTCYALSLAKLLELVRDVRTLYKDLTALSDVSSNLAQQASSLLKTTALLPKRLTGGYFVPLQGALAPAKPTSEAEE